MSTLACKDVITEEKNQLRQRRRRLGLSGGTPESENWFGIALSGGGIRSATINLGFLKTLNRFGILQKADYLSSVSGGGYVHSYVQATLKEKCDYRQLFTDEQIAAMRQHGEYLIPGQGYWKMINAFLLGVAFVVSWLMSLLSLVIVVGVIYDAYLIVAGLLGKNPFSWMHVRDESEICWWGTMMVGSLLLIHALSNLMLNFSLGVSKAFNRIETVAVVLALGFWAFMLVVGYRGAENPGMYKLMDYVLNGLLLYILGFFLNPNALSFHRFYRKQLADLFLRFSGAYKNMPLRKVFDIESSNTNGFIAPYPLINTCLNLQNPGGDDKFKGAKASDYFLLSPLYCGSKLTGYVSTDRYLDYRSMTLPAAVTVSAAAMNPGLGVYSNKMLSVMMTLFNARLGYWISNPLVLEKAFSVVWWPAYFFKELLGRIGTNNKMVNISDGGHIENLGVYELLRRGCRLIIAFDAGEDRLYTFADLNNLLLRARNEMGLEIRFRDDHQPEELIRPRPSRVYSKQRFAVADILQWWEDRKVPDPEKPGQLKTVIENFDEPKKVGTFIYVKSAVTAPIGKPALDEDQDRLKYGTYKYKIYHPDFPHEPTSDQFFDEIQWEAYYQLGQYIGADVLGLSDLENAPERNFDVQELLDWFDHPKDNPLFGAAERAVAAPVERDEFESIKGAVEAPPAAAAEEPAKRDVGYRM